LGRKSAEEELANNLKEEKSKIEFRNSRRKRENLNKRM